MTGLRPKYKEEMARVTNLEKKAGSLADVIVGADVFIGVSAPGTLSTEMVRSMARDTIASGASSTSVSLPKNTF